MQTAVHRLLYLLTYFIVQFLGVWSGSIRSRDFSAADRRVVGRQGPSTMRGGGGGGGAELKASSLISPRSQQPALGRGLREEREIALDDKGRLLCEYDVVSPIIVIIIGATTAEKLEGTSSGMDAEPLLLSPPSLPHLPLLLHPCFTHSLPYSAFPHP